MVKEDKHQRFKDDFAKRKPDFEQLRTICFGLIQNALKQNGIDCLSIESRVKSNESALEKSKSNKYSDPILEITDFVALRVIVFLDRDIDAAASALRSLFQVDTENSIDKRLPEKVDTVGYRSLHLVCSLGEDRSRLPEYKNLDKFPFEIQIRTALQHAWAEIEHKRRYKGAATLPNELQHRLMALSGTLELVDREFSAIATEAEAYASSLKDKSVTDNDHDTLSEIAIMAVFDGFISTSGLEDQSENTSAVESDEALTGLLAELIDFKITSVGELKKFIQQVDVKGIAQLRTKTNRKIKIVGFFKVAMMLNDFDRYFSDAFSHDFDLLEYDEFEFLKAKLKRNDLETLLNSYDVDVFPF